MIALHATFDAVDPNDENVKLFTIKKHLSFGKANLSLTFNNRAGGGEPVEFKLKGCGTSACMPLRERRC